MATLATISLADRLRQRRGEIEQATLARVHAISDPADVNDPDYVTGLEEAVSAGFAYGLTVIEAPRLRDSTPDPIPIQLLSQARHAARSGVPLDTVLRRYFAAYTLLGDFLTQAAEEDSIAACELQGALRGAAALFDRLVTVVSQEYTLEAEGRSRTTEERRTAQVRMLLGGEPLDSHELGYELDAWHVGAVVAGTGVGRALRSLASALDRNLLLVHAEKGAVWAWLGGRDRLPTPRTLSLAQRYLPQDTVMALGEPGRGIEAWRLSHRQARAAMTVAERGPKRLVRYADVGLLAAALGDGLLGGSLRDIYLAPLERRRGASNLIETLRAYFATGRNVSSTAAALGVSRKTVSIRLRLVEEIVDRPLEACAPEMETALALRELGTAGHG